MKRYLILFLLLLFAPASWAATIEVDTIAEMTAAATNAGAGDTIRILPGTYDNWGEFVFTQTGTEGNEITVDAANQGDVVFTGDIKFRINGGDWYIFQKLDFTDVNNEVGEQNNVFAVHNGATNIRISYCRFYSPGREGLGRNGVILLADSDTIRIDHCLFDDTRQSNIIGDLSTPNSQTIVNVTIDHNTFQNKYQGDTGESAVYAGAADPHNYGDEVTNWIVEYNTISNYSTDTENPGWEIVGFKTSGNIIRYNDFSEEPGYNPTADSFGISLRQGNANEVYGNTFANMSVGIKVLGADHEVWNNIFYNNQHAMIFFTGTVGSIVSLSGSHDGGNNQAILTDSGESWEVDELIGLTLTNTTKSEDCVITDNDATSATCTLSGGADWDNTNTYTIYCKNNPPAFCQATIRDGVYAYNTIIAASGDEAISNQNTGAPNYVPTSNDVSNNVIVGPKDVLVYQTLCDNNTVDKNVFDTLDDSAVTPCSGTNAIEDDADLIGSGISSRLTAVSPAVDAAINVPNWTDPVVDIDFDDRPYNTVNDIGADEFVNIIIDETVSGVYDPSAPSIMYQSGAPSIVAP